MPLIASHVLAVACGLTDYLDEDAEAIEVFFRRQCEASGEDPRHHLAEMNEVVPVHLVPLQEQLRVRVEQIWYVDRLCGGLGRLCSLLL